MQRSGFYGSWPIRESRNIQRFTNTSMGCDQSSPSCFLIAVHPALLERPRLNYSKPTNIGITMNFEHNVFANQVPIVPPHLLPSLAKRLSKASTAERVLDIDH